MGNSALIYSPDIVSPPGRTLKRAIDAVGMTQSDLAVRLGKTEKFVSELINGKAPITPETAIHLERVLGTPASFWNNRESNYRSWRAREQQAEQLRALDGWARSFPIGKMVEYSWIAKQSSVASRVEALLQFFGIATPNEWESVWHEKLATVKFRKSAKFAADNFALSAWLRYGEIRSQEIDMPDFDRRAFERVLLEARGLTVLPPEGFQPRLTALCHSAGVVLVFTPDLPKTRVYATTRWHTPRRPLIQLGLRYKTDDHLWFSFFHEAFHVLRHSKKAFFLGCDEAHSAEEDEADRLAANLLIPRDKYKAFVDNFPFSKAKIVAFSKEIGIAPGIVVGRLQHDHLLPPSHCNDLKRRYEWANAS